MPGTSPSATPDPLAQTSPLSSTPTSSTNEQDPHARYVSPDFLVYESLVRYVVGDRPLDDTSNRRIQALKAAGADLAYLGFWRHRYELAYHFFASKPESRSQPTNLQSSANKYRTTPPELHAAVHADEDARNHFGRDPEDEAEARIKQAQDQSIFDALARPQKFFPGGSPNVGTVVRIDDLSV